MIFKFRLDLLLTTFFLLLFYCKFPYEPETEEPVTAINPVTSNESNALVKKIVPGKQICNPSISKDTIHFPACMLWLNFGGSLPVKTDAFTSGYPATANQHDRLTISDSSNTVRWYFMKDVIVDDPNFHFQDPEWSAHPEYIGTLLGNSNVFDTWSFYAIHPQSNTFIKIIDRRLNEISTPHLWVESTTPSFTHQIPSDTTYGNNGLLNREAVTAFFGTSKVKIVYSIRENGYLSLYYIDYASESTVPVKLQSLSGESNVHYNYESALISPDGNWIVYNAYQNSLRYSAYVQKLSPQSKPVLLKEGASDPHWWTNPATDQLYVVYTEIKGDNYVSPDLSDPQFLVSGELGSTFMQRVHLNAGLPSALSVELDSPVNMIHLPLKGGLSPDGHFLCTGYKYAYIVELL
jgi:hypothetical protein